MFELVYSLNRVVNSTTAKSEFNTLRINLLTLEFSSKFARLGGFFYVASLVDQFDFKTIHFKKVIY